MPPYSLPQDHLVVMVEVGSPPDTIKTPRFLSYGLRVTPLPSEFPITNEVLSKLYQDITADIEALNQQLTLDLLKDAAKSLPLIYANLTRLIYLILNFPTINIQHEKYETLSAWSLELVKRQKEIENVLLKIVEINTGLDVKSDGSKAEIEKVRACFHEVWQQTILTISPKEEEKTRSKNLIVEAKITQSRSASNLNQPPGRRATAAVLASSPTTSGLPSGNPSQERVTEGTSILSPSTSALAQPVAPTASVVSAAVTRAPLPTAVGQGHVSISQSNFGTLLKNIGWGLLCVFTVLVAPTLYYMVTRELWPTFDSSPKGSKEQAITNNAQELRVVGTDSAGIRDWLAPSGVSASSSREPLTNAISPRRMPLRSTFAYWAGAGAGALFDSKVRSPRVTTTTSVLLTEAQPPVHNSAV